jgi:hypothetical protein
MCVFVFNPFNAELHPICHLVALLGAHLILHVSRIRVNIPQCSTFILPVFVVLCSCNVSKFASYMPVLTKCCSGVSNTPELYSGAFMFKFKVEG